MFWLSRNFIEEEWSLSAKLLGGLVFNPFSLPNHPDRQLLKWLVERATGRELSYLPEWQAKPEYQGTLGRNDWRVQVDQATIVVECKFGDGIDPINDCLKYLERPGRSNGSGTWVLVIASVSELAELTQTARASGESCQPLIDAIRNRTVRLMAWHEIVEASCRCTADESVKAVLNDWAGSVARNGLRLMPENLASGPQIENMIMEGKASSIAPVHRRDARGERKPTASLKGICEATGTPEWVAQSIEDISEHCSQQGWIFEPKRGNWINIRRRKTSPSVTIIPWSSGVTFVVSHPPGDWSSPVSLLPMSELQGCRNLPKKPQWFPQNRTIGLGAVDSTDAGQFVRDCLMVCDAL